MSETAPDVIVTLRTEHRYMRFLLDTLAEQLQESGLETAADYYLLQDIARYLHEYTDTVHHPTEDKLFERLVKRDPASKSNIDRLQKDHEKLERGTAKISELLEVASRTRTAVANEAVLRMIQRYIEQLQKHMNIEESIMFPRTIECLGNKDWKKIAAYQGKSDDPLFGDSVEHDYRPLFEYFSTQTTNVSRRLTQSGLMRFDNFVISADALQRDAQEMVSLVSGYASSLATDAREAKDTVVQNPSIGTVVTTPFKLTRSLSGRTFDFGMAATSLYIKALKHAATPFVGGLLDSKQDHSA